MCPRLRISDTSPPALSSKLLSVARVELAGDAGDQTRSFVDFVPILPPVQGGQESWAARESSRKCLGSLHARAGGVCSSAVGEWTSIAHKSRRRLRNLPCTAELLPRDDVAICT